MKATYNCAAADIGGTGGKLAIAAYNGDTLKLGDEVTFPNREVYAGGALYWDILSLYADVDAGLLELSQQREINSLGIDTWGVDFGLLDSNRKLMGNIYHMRDFRTQGIPEEIFQTISEKELFYNTASDASRFYGLYQLYETQKNSSYMLENAEYLMFTPDLLNFFFTGEIGLSDITMAGTSQLLDNTMTQWNFPLFKQLGIPTHFFHTLGYPGEITGKTKSGVPVVRVAGHDSASAVACLKDGAFYVSGGTYLVTGFKSDHTILNDRMIQHDFKNTTGPDHKFLAYKNVTGFWTLKEVMSEYERKGEVYGYGELVILAEKEEPFRSLIDVNRFSERHPSMIGSIQKYCEQTGQAAPQSPGQLARCLYESYAMQIRDCFLAAEEISGEKREEIFAINGTARNALLCQMIADATGVPVYAGMPRATILGNAGIQLVAAGEIKNLTEFAEIMGRSTPYKVFEPQNTERWAEEYERLYDVIIGGEKMPGNR